MTAQLPTAILFDLDDTILARGQRSAVLLLVAEEFAAELHPLTPAALVDGVEAVMTAIGGDAARHKATRLDIPAALRGAMAEVFAGIGAQGVASDLAQRFAARFMTRRAEMIEVYPSARETILTLRERGVRLALVTNGAADVQRAKIERFDLAPLFGHVQVEGEHGFGKPEERAYLHAMAALGVQPHETWMVGDHLEWDVAAPQRLGIHAVWHDHLGAGLPPGSTVRPDRIIRSLADLLT